MTDEIRELIERFEKWRALDDDLVEKVHEAEIIMSEMVKALTAPPTDAEIEAGARAISGFPVLFQSLSDWQIKQHREQSRDCLMAARKVRMG